MTYRWHVPRTINDKNEIGIPRIPIYVTADELRIVIAGVACCFFGGFSAESFLDVKWGTVVGLGMCVPAGIILWLFFGTYRKGKHQAYLWNAFYTIGLYNGKKGIVPYRRGRQRILTWWARGMPSTWKSGTNRPFVDAHVSMPWQRLRAPLVAVGPVTASHTPRGVRRHPDLEALTEEHVSAFG